MEYSNCNSKYKKVITKLDIDLETYVIDSREQDDIFLAFLKAGICGADASTDLALAEVTYRMAKKYGVKYVFEGHSFQAEGVSPLNNSYTDGKFIKSVVKTHSNRELITYPNMTFWRFIWWTVLIKLKKFDLYGILVMIKVLQRLYWKINMAGKIMEVIILKIVYLLLTIVTLCQKNLK